MITELEKKVLKYFDAEEKFRERDMNAFWLNEMKRHKEWILTYIHNHEKEEQEKNQLKLFK